ncbi:hypothetical protein FB45DRAFT_871431 [Roridomyces roridus]|uniref:Uncharacterized protein n=1 Tax=Roridomyces roridus TaxID=1738132 RepID=A0AAD7BGX8_9AGAR|nr:hypothetical protein FB45DRAFT_871431 [Roridomyces roridus]
MSTIHPALLPHNISKLPFSLQRVARNATSQGSWTKTSSISIQKLSSMGTEETLGLLPIIYVLLDSSGIPSLDIDTATTMVSSMQSTMLTWSLLERALCVPTFPVAATADLWPRVWAWMEFVSLYSNDLVEAWQAATFFRPVLEVVVKFAARPPTRRAMVSTPGLRRVLATAWTHHVQLSDGDGQISRQLNDIGVALYAMSAVENPDDFSEVLDGCGGRDTFCLMLTHTIDLASRHPALSSAVSTVGQVCLLLDSMKAVASDIFPLLLSHGFIPPLVSSLAIVGPPKPAQHCGVPFPLTLGSLAYLLFEVPGYRWLEQALQAGLLNQIVSWGSKRGIMHAAHPDVAQKFPELLEKVLPQALVYYPVIVQMRKAFANVKAPSSDGEFARSGLYGLWSNLKALLDERTGDLEDWEATGRPSALIAKPRHIAHGHASVPIGRRGTGTIADFICSRLRVPIAIEMIRSMAEYPDNPVAVGFDYSRGSAQVNVFPISMLDSSKIITPHSQRLARAGGHLVAHKISLGFGSATFHAVWPLCASAPEFYDGLKEIARTAEGLEDAELEPQVLELIEKTKRKGITEFHYC